MSSSELMRAGDGEDGAEYNKLLKFSISENRALQTAVQQAREKEIVNIFSLSNATKTTMNF